MDEITDTVTVADTAEVVAETQAVLVQEGMLEDELLVEEISIDGMCGVY